MDGGVMVGGVGVSVTGSFFYYFLFLLLFFTEDF